MTDSQQCITLWGTPHSLYTGKIRSYLIKKGISFRERMPAEPAFQQRVVPVVGAVVVPILELADGTIVQEADFLDLPQRTVRVRDRSQCASANLRRPDCLPPAEVRQAIVEVLQTNLGGQREELPGAVARMLGLAAVTTPVRELILIQLDALQAANAVSFNGTLYRLPA